MENMNGNFGSKKLIHNAIAMVAKEAQRKINEAGIVHVKARVIKQGHEFVLRLYGHELDVRLAGFVIC